MLRAERQWNNWNARCKTLARMNEFTLATTLAPGRALQDHPRARAMLNKTVRDQNKHTHREAK